MLDLIALLKRFIAKGQTIPSRDETQRISKHVQYRDAEMCWPSLIVERGAKCKFLKHLNALCGLG